MSKHELLGGKSYAEVARENNMSAQTLARYIKRGISLEEIISNHTKPWITGKRYECFGAMLTPREAARRYGLSERDLRNRMVHRDMTMEEAVTIPKRVHKNSKYGQYAFYPCFGEMLTVDQCCEKYNIAKMTICNRMGKQGMTMEQAVTRQKPYARTRYEYHGQSVSVYDLAEMTGYSEGTIHKRLQAGSTPEEIVQYAKENPNKNTLRAYMQFNAHRYWTIPSCKADDRNRIVAKHLHNMIFLPRQIKETCFRALSDTEYAFDGDEITYRVNFSEDECTFAAFFKKDGYRCMCRRYQITGAGRLIEMEG